MAAALLLALVAAALWLAAPGGAAAHANLASADPAPNSELADAPGRVIIWFTEPIEPGLSEIRVLDAAGRQVDRGDSAVDDLNPLAMSVGLGDVPDGTYTVAWSNVSTVDGHRVRGSFVFAAGQPLSGGPVATAGQPLLQSPLAPGLRWLALLGALTMLGGLTLELLVTRPVLDGAGASAAAAGGGPGAGRADAAADVGGLGRLCGGVGQGNCCCKPPSPMRFPYGAFSAGRYGASCRIRNGGICGCGGWRRRGLSARRFISGRGLSPHRGRNRGRRTAALVVTLGLGGAVLWAWALTSHGAATVEIRNMALAADFLHLAAAAFWIGALFHFVVGLPALRHLEDAERRECLAELVPRFSVAAALSVAVIVVTGAFSGWAQVTEVGALATPYGATLIAKVGLALPLLLLGGVNLVWVRPRLRRDPAAGAWLKRLMWGEAALAALVLAAVGLLTSLEPARQVASRELAAAGQSRSFSDTVAGDRIGLEVSPGRVGANDVTVTLTDRLGQPISNADEVTVRLVYLGDSLGDDTLAAAPAGEGVYVRENAQLSIAGVWQAELTVRRPDAFDARTAFRFELLGAGAGGSAAISPAPETAYRLLGAGLLVLGLLFLGAGLPLGGWFSRTGAGVMTPGVAGAAAGLLLLFNAQLGLGGGQPLVNPFPPTPESLDLGAASYGQVCQTCHGDSGRGDGPAAAGLAPPPADLTIHVPLHPEADLFRFIRDGIPGTAMAPQGGRLGEDQIWHIVNYIRTLE